MRVYRLKVSLAQSPYFEARGDGVWRTIEIRGDQTLHRFHGAIFKAFHRFDDHLYSFFLSQDRRDASSEYASPYFFEDDDFTPGDTPKNAEDFKLDDLDLKRRRKFYYLFDYGDAWEHVVEVLAVIDNAAPGRYPKIVERHGESPPQYPPSEEEDWEEEAADAEHDEDAKRISGKVIPLFPEIGDDPKSRTIDKAARRAAS